MQSSLWQMLRWLGQDDALPSCSEHGVLEKPIPGGLPIIIQQPQVLEPSLLQSAVPPLLQTKYRRSRLQSCTLRTAPYISPCPLSPGCCHAVRRSQPCAVSYDGARVSNWTGMGTATAHDRKNSGEVAPGSIPAGPGALCGPQRTAALSPAPPSPPAGSATPW